MTRRPRLGWLDLARGVAVVSMVVAHTCPMGGVLNVSEYLTAPLFALLVGVSMAYAWAGSPATPLRFWSEQVLRGMALIVLGIGLQAAYAQIWDVLITLGVLTALLPPLVWLGHSSRGALASVAALCALAMPPARIWAEGHLDSSAPDPTLGETVVRTLVFFGFGHPTYRLLAFLAVAGIGVLLSSPLAERHWSVRRCLGAAAVAALVSGGAVWVGKRTGWGGDPYAGTHPEWVASAAIAVAAVLACHAVWQAAPGSHRMLQPLVATGRLALTCYTLHVLSLRAITDLLLGGGSDDLWWVLAVELGLLVGAATAWHHGIDRVGPVEWLVRLPARLLRLARSNARPS